MVTFDQARDIVRALEEPTWPGPGTYMVADWGAEDATHWRVVTGAREHLVDDDRTYGQFDAPVWFVDKTTGAAHWSVYLPGNLTAGKLEDMTNVGTPPPRPPAEPGPDWRGLFEVTDDGGIRPRG